ncbi:MAG: hypothetical protein ACRCYU_21805, partial [Nocardioides sp.]
MGETGPPSKSGNTWRGRGWDLPRICPVEGVLEDRAHASDGRGRESPVTVLPPPPSFPHALCKNIRTTLPGAG